MKTRAVTFLVLVCATVGFVIGFTSCSKLKSDLPIAATGELAVHPDGWASPSSGANFHGMAIRNAGWDMRPCKVCHGNNYDGGTSGVSCLTCHTAAAGPENCSTCHGSATSTAPPPDLEGNTATTARGVGGHQFHLMGSTASAAYTCAECHNIPGGVYATGHIVGSQAQVVMGNYLANLETNASGTPVIPNPTYDPVTGTCSGTYCHGAFKNGNTSNTVTWTDSTSAACGTCHGNPNGATLALKALPGGTHEQSNTQCSTCHGGVVNASLGFTNPSKHGDGKLNLNGQDKPF